jgi:lipoprotein signal peptidase
MAPRTFRRLFIILAVVGLTTDQASKYGVFRLLYHDGRGGEQEVVTGWFKLVTQFDPAIPKPEGWTAPLQTWSGEAQPRVNYGALFGLGTEHKALANRVFAGISLAAAVAIIVWMTRRQPAEDRLLSAALGLILGGTLGNLYDRLVFGGVRDFLYFYYIDWPVFNVADCCLVCGAGLLLLQAFLVPAKDGQPAAEQPAVEVAGAKPA